MSEVTDSELTPDEDLTPALLIMLMRIYDLLSLQMDQQFPKEFQVIHEIHEKGGVLSAEPFLDPEFSKEMRDKLHGNS